MNIPSENETKILMRYCKHFMKGQLRKISVAYKHDKNEWFVHPHMNFTNKYIYQHVFLITHNTTISNINLYQVIEKRHNKK